MSRKDGGPAFPVASDGAWMPDVTGKNLPIREFPGSSGMTLRDYFAAHALGSMIIQLGNHLPDQATHEHFAELSYSMADAMLIEREK